ncbi:MAG: NADPH:quinone reductase [Mesorhizobium sp.]|nr:NADPH:quinone reductase [Mesorhizobium sp.]MCO5160376.1 NADPH:quinone reductase [Mesorhizobium sp.]
MQAAWYERNGAAAQVLNVGDMDMPEPGPNEVRVKIHTSGVNPSDVKSRRGRPPMFPRIIPHSDGAGVIDAVGKGIDHSRIGERVWIWNAQWKRAFGTAAEYCVLPSEQAVHLPKRVDFATGACLGIPALTALQAVRHLGQIGGKTILITGAGSSVGHYATQFAKARGARVIGTASAAKAEHARNGGADFVVDYQAKDVASVVKHLTQNKGVDGIIDMDLSSTAKLIAEAVMAPHATMVCYGSNQASDIALNFPALLWNSYTLKFFLVYDLKPEERRATTAELTKFLEDGGIRHSVGPRFLLRDIARAHEEVEEGKAIGNVVLDIA